MSISEGTAKSTAPRFAASALDSTAAARLTPVAVARAGDALARLEDLLMERVHTHEAAAATLRRLIARAELRGSRLPRKARRFAPTHGEPSQGEPPHGRFQVSTTVKRPPVLPQVSG